jgi:hypothetical protein
MGEAKVFSVVFSVIGSCSQTIDLEKDCPYTPEEIVEALNGCGDRKIKGTVATTIQEGGEVIFVDGDGDIQVLGRVFSSSVDAEYEEFEVRD